MASFAMSSRLPGDESLRLRGSEIINIEAQALVGLAASLDDAFIDACKLIERTQGRLVITGMGKSGHIGRKAAATFSATGTPAMYVHPGEAAHGDLGMLVRGDVLLVISNSGNTAELKAFLSHARLIQVPVIGVASRANSLVMRYADVQLIMPEAREACNSNIAPTTSTTMQLAMCDALALTVMDLRGFSSDRMKALHPGGVIGLRVLPVGEIMHRGSALPLVRQDTRMPEVLSMMTSSGYGIAGIVDQEGNLLGVITDGDLRRHFVRLALSTAAEVMTTSPRTLASDMSAEAALEMMSDERITAAFVLDVTTGKPVGVVHMHDFVRIGLS